MNATSKFQLPGKIIYIMGPGRCGTTLMEVLLSNSHGISGCGELSHIFRDGFISNQRCSCGELTSDCKEWGLRLKKSGWNPVDIVHFNKLFSLFSSHALFPLIFLGLLKKAKSIEYKTINEILFSTIKDTTTHDVIVDSSKYSGRALELAKQFPEKVYIIAMTRSAAGVLHSFSKTVPEQEPKSTFSAMVYYCYVLFCMRLVCLRKGLKLKKISYESLCASPLKVICEIEDFCGTNLEVTKNKIESDTPLKIGHIVTGNRFRNQSKIKFKSKPESVEISLATRLAAALMDRWRRLLGF